MSRTQTLEAGHGFKTKHELIAELESLRRRVRALEVAEDALRESEARLKAILDNAPATIYLKDLDGRFVVVNRHFEERFQVSAELARGAKAHDVGPKRLADAVVAQEAEALRARAPIEKEETWYLPEGERNYSVIKFPVLDSTGAIIAMGGIETDITERKRAEEARRKSDARLKAIMDNAPVEIILKDREGRYLWVNRAFETHFGKTDDEVRGKTLVEAFPEPDWDEVDAAGAAHERAVIASGEARQYEYCYPRADSLHPVIETKFPIKDETGEIVGLGSISIDITERKRMEEALREAKEEAEKANLAKSRFLAAASHDLRQPLHALGLFTSALTAKVRGKETRLLAAKIKASLDALDRMFGALLDISKLEAGAVRPDIVDVPVAGLLERLTAEFAPQAGEKGIDFHAVSCDATVRSDPALLERILRNLIVNAVRCTSQGRILLGCRRRDSSLRIEVWDSGRGIAEDQIDEAFREFRRLDGGTGGSDEGLGLGLTIVERTSRLLGHRIHVTSALGKGSMFAVEAPLVRAGDRARGPRARPMQRPGQVAGATVLVIDDEANVLEGTRAMLQSWGCRVLAADSATEALACLVTLDGAPDLIVADYHLGGALNGIQTIRLLRDELGSDIPALIMTGDTAPERLWEATAGGHRLFQKTCGAERFRAMLAEILDPNLAAVP